MEVERWQLYGSPPLRSVPAKGPVGVDDAQGVEGGVHHLPGAQHVHHHGDAQTANQNAQRNIHHPTYRHT